MKSIFDRKTYEDVLDRIGKLNQGSQPEWGKMDAAQMLCHCRYPLEVAMGKKEIKKPGPLMRLLYKSFKSALYNDKPWRKNLKTAKEYKVVSSKDFNQEKEKLAKLIHEFHQLRERERWDPHPSFGHFTHDQWGMLQYKHLDHHLRQFGA